MTDRNPDHGYAESSGIIKRAAALFDCFKSANRTRVLRCVSETYLRMKTIDTLIDFFDRLATPRIAQKFLPRKEMTDTQIEIIENKLLDLTIEGQEAARRYADLYRSRLNWEETRSAEHRHD